MIKNSKLNTFDPSKLQRLLTVCYGNLYRSRTAEWLLHRDYVVESCGVWAHALVPINRKHIEFADTIIVMEDYMADEIATRYPEAKDKIVIIGVQDNIICAELILELNNKLRAQGFVTLDIDNIYNSLDECRGWVNKKIRSIQNNPVSPILGIIKE